MPHPRLTNKTSSSTIADTILQWLPSSLSFRSQALQVKGFVYEPRMMPSGTIQGSILGYLMLLQRERMSSVLFETLPPFSLLAITKLPTPFTLKPESLS